MTKKSEVVTSEQVQNTSGSPLSGTFGTEADEIAAREAAREANEKALREEDGDSILAHRRRRLYGSI